jgi:hypothetical protein
MRALNLPPMLSMKIVPVDSGDEVEDTPAVETPESTEEKDRLPEDSETARRALLAVSYHEHKKEFQEMNALQAVSYHEHKKEFQKMQGKTFEKTPGIPFSAAFVAFHVITICAFILGQFADREMWLHYACGCLITVYMIASFCVGLCFSSSLFHNYFCYEKTGGPFTFGALLAVLSEPDETTVALATTSLFCGILPFGLLLGMFHAKNDNAVIAGLVFLSLAPFLGPYVYCISLVTLNGKTLEMLTQYPLEKSFANKKARA